MAQAAAPLRSFLENVWKSLMVSPRHNSYTTKAATDQPDFTAISYRGPDFWTRHRAPGPANRA